MKARYGGEARVGVSSPKSGCEVSSLPPGVIANSISSTILTLAIRISMRYVVPVIRSFKGKFAELILQGRMVPKGFRQISPRSLAEN